MKRINIVAIVTAITLASCQSVVKNVEVPQIDRKVVAQVLIDNLDAKHRAVLTKSNTIFDPKNEYEVVLDAVVEVTGEQSKDSFTYSSNLEMYFVNNASSFEEGKQYDLNIKTVDGTNLYASETYPLKPRNVTVKVDSTSTDKEVRYDFDLRWERTSQQDDYYQVEMVSVVDFGGTEDTISFYVDEPFVDGNKFNGNIAKKKGFVTFYSDFGQEQMLLDMWFIVSGINKSHFEYEKFLYDYDPENPFSEPVSVPSNVEGGLGMFVLKNSVKVNR